MPRIKSGSVFLQFDMHGCPNACRHCWLGRARGAVIDEKDVRRTANQFRDHRRPGDNEPLFKNLTVFSWFREPDFARNYRELHALEQELSDGEVPRFELLSVWRLARDPEYATWAAETGPDKCQISFFGMEETTDWFCRRKGAFQDSLLATERLLEAGIKPRWQLFLTRKILPELDDLMRLIDGLRLRERVNELGGEFELFIHPPGPDGEGMKIEHLRPTLAELQHLPGALLTATEKHLGRATPWQSEAELYAKIIEEEDALPVAYEPMPDPLFRILGNFDAYFDERCHEPWWRLGNLKRDGVAAIVSAYEENRCPGLAAAYSLSGKALCREFGNPSSQLVYESKSDLMNLYLNRYLEREYPIH